MAKTITIPKEFGYPTADFWVEGIKYTYETGKAVSVDDKVAEIVANASALDPKEGNASAGDRFVVNSYVDANDSASCDKTYEEVYDAIQKGKNVVCQMMYRGSNAGVFDVDLIMHAWYILSARGVANASNSVFFYSEVDAAIGKYGFRLQILQGGKTNFAVSEL